MNNTIDSIPVIDCPELTELKKTCYECWFKTNDYYYLAVSESKLNKLDTLLKLVEARHGKWFNDSVLRLQVQSVVDSDRVDEAFEFCIRFLNEQPYDTLNNYSVFGKAKTKELALKFSFPIIEGNVFDFGLYLAEYLYNNLQFEKSEELVNLSLQKANKYSVFNK